MNLCQDYPAVIDKNLAADFLDRIAIVSRDLDHAHRLGAGFDGVFNLGELTIPMVLFPGVVTMLITVEVLHLIRREVESGHPREERMVGTPFNILLFLCAQRGA